jgi:hypothetical protein
MVHIKNSKDLYISESEFYSEYGVNSKIYNAIFLDNLESGSLLGNKTCGKWNKFSELNDCKSISIQGNDIFVDCPWDIGLNVKHGNYGITSTQGQGFTWQGNTINYCERGMEFYQNFANSTLPSTFEANTFYNVQYGITTSTNEFPLGLNTPVNNYNNSINVKMYCNQFTGSDIAILNCGKLPDQKTATGKAVGNLFSNGVITDYNVIFENNGSPIEYRHKSVLAENPTINPSNINPSQLINGSSISSQDLVKFPTSLNNCSLAPINNLEVTTEILNIEVYPNPSNKVFNIVLNGVKAKSAKLYNQVGQVVLEIDLAEAQSFGEDLKSGMYYLQIENKCWRLIKI